MVAAGWAKFMGMKGLSVLVTILLLLFANALAVYLRQSGALPVSAQGARQHAPATQTAADEALIQPASTFAN